MNIEYVEILSKNSAIIGKQSWYFQINRFTLFLSELLCLKEREAALTP